MYESHAPYIYIGVALEPWQQRSTHKARGFTDDINASSLRAPLMIIPQTPEPDGRRKSPGASCARPMPESLYIQITDSRWKEI